MQNSTFKTEQVQLTVMKVTKNTLFQAVGQCLLLIAYHILVDHRIFQIERYFDG